MGIYCQNIDFNNYFNNIEKTMFVSSSLLKSQDCIFVVVVLVYFSRLVLFQNFLFCSVLAAFLVIRHQPSRPRPYPQPVLQSHRLCDAHRNKDLYRCKQQLLYKKPKQKQPQALDRKQQNNQTKRFNCTIHKVINSSSCLSLSSLYTFSRLQIKNIKSNISPWVSVTLSLSSYIK